MIKKIVFLLLIICGLSSCSSDDDRIEFYFEAVGVTEVGVPESFNVGQTYEIFVRYNRPTECHTFAGFDYVEDGNTRTIGVVNRVVSNQGPCAVLENEEVFQFFFLEARDIESYTLRFYAGLDDNDEPSYIEKIVPVNN